MSDALPHGFWAVVDDNVIWRHRYSVRHSPKPSPPCPLRPDDRTDGNFRTVVFQGRSSTVELYATRSHALFADLRDAFVPGYMITGRFLWGITRGRFSGISTVVFARLASPQKTGDDIQASRANRRVQAVTIETRQSKGYLGR